MTIDYMRDKVAGAFDTVRWVDRVRRMPNSQVVAIYHSMRERGVFDKPKCTKKKEEQYRQMNIFDYIERTN